MSLMLLLLLLIAVSTRTFTLAATNEATFVGPWKHRLLLEVKPHKTPELFAANERKPPEAEKDHEKLAAMVVPFGESSRKYVRTVYGHSDWIRHRSESRVFRNIRQGIFRAGAWRQLRREVGSVVALSILVVFWNALFECKLGLPVTPFMMSSPALGLMLVFRTNASYGRWCEARIKWGSIVNHSNNIVRLSACYADKSSNESRFALERVCRATWALPRTLMTSLAGADEDGKSYEQEIRQVFQNGTSENPTTFADYILDVSSCPPDLRTSAALLELTMALDKLPVDSVWRIEIDKSVVLINDCIGSCQSTYGPNSSG